MSKTTEDLINLITANQEATIKAIESNKSNRGWEIVRITLPIALTAGLGFWIWSLQSGIQRTVDDNNRLLSTRLALTEEFYKRKLTVYENASKEVARLRQVLERLEEQQFDPEVGKSAADSVSAIDSLRKSDVLYLSENLQSDLAQLWDLGTARMQINEDDDALKQGAMQKIVDQVTTLGKHMKDDLQIFTVELRGNR
jgi:hypothetical protein